MSGGPVSAGSGGSGDTGGTGGIGDAVGCAPHPREFARIQREASAAGARCVVGAVLVNPLGEVFLQRRAPHVRLFPGCWDIVGGHVEEGETLCVALAREIAEETGWRLVRVDGVVDVFDWGGGDGGDGARRREIDVLATVTGDLTRPRIERDKFVEARWLDAAGLRRLADSSTGDTGMIDLALRGLAMRAPGGSAAPPPR
ncbi:8-oxo-dGTP pyrophosphatase MutT (NUDIX family) [Streptosporangium becharense]|uniref:8-oxo-dGTP pyrophosphatase MutT (NUDIX family) n=1 Tax=Streptosporangium becharense TaxID=1816182 RepID=A0A7W9IKS4_9ACTN|nr:NUDIX domain-containing protein [Streptosporangium becharense]MBB2911685.1 8-oxo-dGTP pyrophosphatase MutT (NUDIX family) [Streptosporangium becharense]MBB5822497.1 8-oxo-dGTP pyrophosphatase MutT (NUDIX family) [Streptosporangium becharense]